MCFDSRVLLLVWSIVLSRLKYVMSCRCSSLTYYVYAKYITHFFLKQHIWCQRRVAHCNRWMGPSQPRYLRARVCVIWVRTRSVRCCLFLLNIFNFKVIIPLPKQHLFTCWLCDLLNAIFRADFRVHWRIVLIYW